MKPVHFIPPVAALVLVVAWILVEQRAISTAENGRSRLREQISTVQAAEHSPGDRKGTGKPRAISQAPGVMDWQATAGLLAEGDGIDAAGLRDTVAFRERLLKMSREEIIASLDEIDGLGLTDEARKLLESSLLGPLMKEDPAYALDRFAERISSDPAGIGSQLADALRGWAKKDPAAATAWFDRQIAAGNFESKTLDGKSDVRVRFEAALLESMLAADPQAVAGRLAALPDDQRREVLEQIPFQNLGNDVQRTYADLVRGLVPADERAGSFAHIASQLVDGTGYGKVDDFLNAVQATPEERSAAAVQTAQSRLESLGLRGGVTRQDVDGLRDWLGRQSPGQVDRITGKALGEASQQSPHFDFDAASKLVLDYQKSTGNDDVLAAFLESYAARSNSGEALGLVDSISDEKLRAEISKRFK